MQLTTTCSKQASTRLAHGYCSPCHHQQLRRRYCHRHRSSLHGPGRKQVTRVAKSDNPAAQEPSSRPIWDAWIHHCRQFHATDQICQQVAQLQQQLQHELGRTYAAETERIKTRLDSLELMCNMGAEGAAAAAEAIAANQQQLTELSSAPDPSLLIPEASHKVLQLQLQLQQLISRDPVAAAQQQLAAALEAEDYSAAQAAMQEGATWMEGWWVGTKTSWDAAFHSGQLHRGPEPDPHGHLLHVTAEHGRWVGRQYTADSLAKVAGWMDDNPLGISVQTLRYGDDPQVVISALGYPLGPPPWRLGVVEQDPPARTLSSEGRPALEIYPQLPAGGAVLQVVNGSNDSSIASGDTGSSSDKGSSSGALQHPEATATAAGAATGAAEKPYSSSSQPAATRLLSAAEGFSLQSAPPPAVLKQHQAHNLGFARSTTSSISTTTDTNSSSSMLDRTSAESSNKSSQAATGVVTFWLDFGAVPALEGREVVRVGMLAQQLGVHRVWDLEVPGEASAASSSPPLSLEPTAKPLSRLILHSDSPNSLFYYSTANSYSSSEQESSSRTGGLFRTHSRPAEYSMQVDQEQLQRLPARLAREGQGAFVVQDLLPPLQQVVPVSSSRRATPATNSSSSSDTTASGDQSSSSSSSSTTTWHHDTAGAFQWQPIPEDQPPLPHQLLVLHVAVQDLDPDGHPPPPVKPWDPVHPSKQEVEAYKALRAAGGKRQAPRPPSEGLGQWLELSGKAVQQFEEAAGRSLPAQVAQQVAAQLSTYAAAELEPRGLQVALEPEALWQQMPADYRPTPCQLSYQQLQVPAESEAEDPLTGLFIGAFGTKGRQLLQLTRQSNAAGQQLVVARKLTGDTRVPAGCEVFRARVGPGQKLPLEGEDGRNQFPVELGVSARYPGEACVAQEGGQAPTWLPGELLLVRPPPEVADLQGAALGLQVKVPGGRHYLSLLNKLQLDQLPRG